MKRVRARKKKKINHQLAPWQAILESDFDSLETAMSGEEAGDRYTRVKECKGEDIRAKESVTEYRRVQDRRKEDMKLEYMRGDYSTITV